MPRECPYHGVQQPCPECLQRRMGQFNRYVPQHGLCMLHHNPAPCMTCFGATTGEFEYLRVVPIVPARMLPEDIIHIRQIGRDTCGVACCAMVGATLNCPTRFDWESLLDYMIERGVYLPGNQSLFHALDYPLSAYLGLRCRMHNSAGIAEIRRFLQAGSVIILEEGGHVIVIFSENADGTFVIGDPYMRKIEWEVPATDYRLTDATGRIWEVKR